MAESCKKIIDQAEAEGKFLYEPTNMVYFAPAALRRLQKEGRFRWSPYNFRLIEPNGTEMNWAGTSGYDK
jgi:hypothetical protein